MNNLSLSLLFFLLFFPHGSVTLTHSFANAVVYIAYYFVEERPEKKQQQTSKNQNNKTRDAIYELMLRNYIHKVSGVAM